jgi:hypothetical protein
MVKISNFPTDNLSSYFVILQNFSSESGQNAGWK